MSTWGKAHGVPKGSYVRDAYRMGLVMEEQIGVNPYKFGLIGSGDGHDGAVAYRQKEQFGDFRQQ